MKFFPSGFWLKLLQVIDKLDHIVVHLTLYWDLIGTGCIGSCKSNYHMITAMTAPIITWVASSFATHGEMYSK